MALVLALVVIRDTVRAAGVPVGPVLMLSYKNHALDEFLLDVLKYSKGSLRPKALIRSGKPDTPELDEYRERFSEEERLAEDVLQQRVGVQRRAYRMAKEWKNFADHFAHRHTKQVSALST